MFAGDIEDLLVPKVTIRALFADVRGLRKNSPVWFSGVEIGSVKAIRFTHQEKIRVEMSISDTTLKYLKKDSRAEIFTLGLLGDKYIEIKPGSGDSEHLKAGDEIQGIAHIEIQDVVETGQESIASLTGFIDMLESVIEKIEKEEGTVSKLIKDPSMYDNLKEVSGGLANLVARIESGKGTAGRLVHDETLYKTVSSSAENVREFTDDLRTSEGTLNKLIEDKSLYENINSVSEKLDVLLERVNSGEGLMGSLVRDEELSDQLKTTLRELNILIKDIQEHPGKYFKFSIF
jgi:phospholipid/cholesterol/gamma-HCH transport system substrate-binding protein